MLTRPRGHRGRPHPGPELVDPLGVVPRAAEDDQRVGGPVGAGVVPDDPFGPGTAGQQGLDEQGLAAEPLGVVGRRRERDAGRDLVTSRAPGSPGWPPHARQLPTNTEVRRHRSGVVHGCGGAKSSAGHDRRSESHPMVLCTRGTQRCPRTVQYIVGPLGQDAARLALHDLGVVEVDIPAASARASSSPAPGGVHDVRRRFTSFSGTVEIDPSQSEATQDRHRHRAVVGRQRGGGARRPPAERRVLRRRAPSKITFRSRARRCWPRVATR